MVSRIVHGFDSRLTELIRQFDTERTIDVEGLYQHLRNNLAYTIPYESLPLQDCIDLAAFLIRTTIVAQNLSVGQHGVGGSIEIVTITPQEGLQWIQKRQIRGEQSVRDIDSATMEEWEKSLYGLGLETDGRNDEIMYPPPCCYSGKHTNRRGVYG